MGHGFSSAFHKEVESGAPGPNLYIANEISANRFRISGGKPRAKVSWQVTGIRHGAYANANRIQVEEEKPANRRGANLHPELFGVPATQTSALSLRHLEARCGRFTG